MNVVTQAVGRRCGLERGCSSVASSIAWVQHCLDPHPGKMLTHGAGRLASTDWVTIELHHYRWPGTGPVKSIASAQIEDGVRIAASLLIDRIVSNATAGLTRMDDTWREVVHLLSRSR